MDQFASADLQVRPRQRLLEEGPRRTEAPPVALRDLKQAEPFLPFAVEVGVARILQLCGGLHEGVAQGVHVAQIGDGQFASGAMMFVMDVAIVLHRDEELAPHAPSPTHRPQPPPSPDSPPCGRACRSWR